MWAAIHPLMSAALDLKEEVAKLAQKRELMDTLSNEPEARRLHTPLEIQQELGQCHGLVK